MWEYVKGSEADFEGAPDWATIVDQTEVGSNDYWFTENYEVGSRFTKKGGYGGISKYDGNNVKSHVIAERRKVDNLQSRVNDANLTEALTGLRVNYYLTQVKQPQREEQPAYQAECEDIIQALQMTFDEGCLFKALWRNAAARLNNGKPGQSSVYDAEKMTHYATRIHKWELSK